MRASRRRLDHREFDPFADDMADLAFDRLDTQAAITLKTRTLTNLYNQRPQWLAHAHRDLDAAVAAAYGWPADISEEDALAKLLELNLTRAGAAQDPEPGEATDHGD
jgi:hypothetical protein